MKSFLQKYGAYIVASVFFIAVSLIYFRPSLTGNIIESPDDAGSYDNGSELRGHDWSKGEYGFWNGSVFSGMPNYQMANTGYESDRLMKPLRNIVYKGAWGSRKSRVFMLIFYFFSFLVVMRAFGVEKWLSILGSTAISLSSYFVILFAAGHYGKTISLTFMPLVAAGFHLIFRKKYVLGAALSVVFTAGAYSPHPQMTYYVFMMTGLFYLAELWIHLKEKRYADLLVGTLVFVLSVGIGIGTGADKLLPNYEFLKESTRNGVSDLSVSYDTEKYSSYKAPDGQSAESSGDDDGTVGKVRLKFATEWDYGILETMSLLIPGFMGGSSAYDIGTDSELYRTSVAHGIKPAAARDLCKVAPMYWGDQQGTFGNVYVGAIICFLFLLGCITLKGPYKWALVAATAFSIMLAWGDNFRPLTYLFFRFFPMYSKFRAVSSVLVVAEIAMPLLACLSLTEILRGSVPGKELKRKILVSAGITAGICLFFALFGGSIFDFHCSNDARFTDAMPQWMLSAVYDGRARLLKSDSWRSVLYILTSAAVLLLFSAGKLKRGWVTALLTVLVFADLWSVDHRYFNDGNFIEPAAVYRTEEIYPYEEAILQDSDPHFRVLNTAVPGPFSSDSRTSRHLCSIGGSTAVKLRRYQDLIDVYLSNYDLRIAGMLNTKYIIYNDKDGETSCIRNDFDLGNAWFVNDILVVDNADCEMDALHVIDLADTAVTDRSFASFVDGFHREKPGDAIVQLTEFQPRYIDYVSESSAPGTIVFSEIYYPHGWKATIDGKPAEHFRVDYTLRALNVPAGLHRIHFEFDPDSIHTGTPISKVCIVIMYVLLALSVGWGVFCEVRSFVKERR